jgi:hypothetical protein
MLSVIGFDRRGWLCNNPARTVPLISCWRKAHSDQRLIDAAADQAKCRLKVELSMPLGQRTDACTSRRSGFDLGYFLFWRFADGASCDLHKTPESD